MSTQTSKPIAIREKAEILQLVPRAMVGKTFPGTRFEVLLFPRREDFDFAEGEKEIRQFIVAKMATYGDALLYAQECAGRPFAELIILRA